MNIKLKARRGRPTGEGEQGAATRAAILDAAERRFADAWRGMHDVKARGESATEFAIEGL